jgi:hypothetical protein
MKGIFMPWFSDNREKKKEARERVFNCGPKRSVLLLPGYRCECASYAIKRGVITKDTSCIFVEREEETAYQIKQWIASEWNLLPPLIHQGELNTLQMFPIDLGYIDLFGNLTKAEIDWMQKELIPNLMPRSDLAFTFSVPIRGNDFMRHALATMNNRHTSLFNDRANKLDLNGDARQIAALYTIIFEKMFCDYKYEINFWTYRDRGPFTMLLVLLNNIIKDPEKLLREYHERKGTGASPL